MIHPTAIIDAKAEVDPSAQIGPYTVVDGSVRIGPGCWIGPHVHLTGSTEIGPNNRIFAGCVIGEAPQDLKYKGEPTKLVIGEGNVFREHVTVHRSNSLAEETRIGSHNFFMANSHVGHNALIGDQVILANGSLLAGHVTIGDRAFISGNCLIHQFVRIGTLALMQGGAGIGKDLPPFVVAYSENRICGLNVIGLRRAGFTEAERLELKRLYAVLFRRRTRLAEALAAARAEFTSEPAWKLLDFVAHPSKRGVLSRHGEAERE